MTSLDCGKADCGKMAAMQNSKYYIVTIIRHGYEVFEGMSQKATVRNCVYIKKARDCYAVGRATAKGEAFSDHAFLANKTI